jgi:putative FmdB family regulatory protein
VPTYEYACTACGERLEAVQSFTDAALTECPACGGALRKVFSPVGVVFKGSGFYKNDSRSTTGSGSTGSTGSTSDTKADTKTPTGDAAAKTKTDSAPAASTSSSTSSAPAAKSA